MVDTACSTDYIYIPGTKYVDEEESQFTTAISDQDEEPDDTDPSRFCGRYFASSAAAFDTNTVSVCSWATPFEVGVEFDSHEYCGANTTGATCESQTAGSNANGGGGILGFSLCYVQHTPPITV